MSMHMAEAKRQRAQQLGANPCRPQVCHRGPAPIAGTGTGRPSPACRGAHAVTHMELVLLHLPPCPPCSPSSAQYWNKESGTLRLYAWADMHLTERVAPFPFLSFFCNFKPYSSSSASNGHTRPRRSSSPKTGRTSVLGTKAPGSRAGVWQCWQARAAPSCRLLRGPPSARSTLGLSQSSRFALASSRHAHQLVRDSGWHLHES